MVNPPKTISLPTNIKVFFRCQNCLPCRNNRNQQNFSGGSHCIICFYSYIRFSSLFPSFLFICPLLFTCSSHVYFYSYVHFIQYFLYICMAFFFIFGSCYSLPICLFYPYAFFIHMYFLSIGTFIHYGIFLYICT